MTKHFCTPQNFIFWGAKKSKNHFWPIFSPFQAILKNFDFFHFWQNIFVRPPIILGGQKKSRNHFLYAPQFFFWWGLKSLKIIFDQFSRHFRSFWTTLIFFIFDQKFFVCPPNFFWGGGNSKIHFDHFSSNYIYQTKFQTPTLQPHCWTDYSGELFCWWWCKVASTLYNCCCIIRSMAVPESKETLQSLRHKSSSRSRNQHHNEEQA